MNRAPVTTNDSENLFVRVRRDRGFDYFDFAAFTLKGWEFHLFVSVRWVGFFECRVDYDELRSRVGVVRGIVHPLSFFWNVCIGKYLHTIQCQHETFPDL